MSEPSKRAGALTALETQVASELMRSGGFPAPAQNKRIVCPDCSHLRQRAHQREKVMSVTTKDDAVLFTCHHCGVSGVFIPEGLRLRDRSFQSSARSREQRIYEAEAVPLKAVVRAQAKRARKTMDGLPACLPPEFIEWDDVVLAFLASRGISRQTCEDLGVAPAMVRGPRGIERVMAFPYRRTQHEAAYAWKLRFIERKGFMCLGKPMGMFGAEHITQGDTVLLVEGEMDVLALAEVGTVAISVPHGASQDHQEQKLRCLEFSFEELELAQRLVIAVDSDDAGISLAEEMARRLGKDRVWQIDWLALADAKDANDVLIAKGRDGLTDALNAAEPWPLTGIVNAAVAWDDVMALYRQENMSGLSTGLPSFDRFYTVAPGMLSVLTGHPNSGKSEWLDQTLMELAGRHGWNICIASFENPINMHIAKLIEKRLGKTFFRRVINRMTEEEIGATKDFIDEHFSFLDFSQGALPTIGEVLDRASLAVRRYGCRGVVIDPFNNLIPETKEGWSTERISEMLTRVKRFAVERGVHVWIVAHPAKMLRFRGELPIPEGNDISGSHTWWSKADHGLTVHRNDDGSVMLRSWKSRFKWLGSQGQIDMNYDVVIGRYSERLEGFAEEVRRDVMASRADSVARAEAEHEARTEAMLAGLHGEVREVAEEFQELVRQMETSGFAPEVGV